MTQTRNRLTPGGDAKIASLAKGITMRITLMAAGEILGTANWDVLPAKDDIIHLRTSTGVTEVRRVDELEDNPSG
jgi:hypothetical protein